MRFLDSYREMGSCTVQADAAYACLLAVADSQVATRVIAHPFWHGETCIGSPAVLEASRVTTLPCQILQPICRCIGDVKLALPAWMIIMPAISKCGHCTEFRTVRLTCMECQMPEHYHKEGGLTTHLC